VRNEQLVTDTSVELLAAAFDDDVVTMAARRSKLAAFLY
jgi:hypothetical protein